MKEVKYRTVWKKHHNSAIPKYHDIHHIDGNHSNNDVNNLKLVTIEEHFYIHYLQKDYRACISILKRILSYKKVKDLIEFLKDKDVFNEIDQLNLEILQNDLDLKRKALIKQEIENGTFVLIRPEVREKSDKVISQYIKEGKMFLQTEAGREMLKQYGKLKIGKKWYNDGKRNILLSEDDPFIAKNNLIKGQLKSKHYDSKGTNWYYNDTEMFRLKPGDPLIKILNLKRGKREKLLILRDKLFNLYKTENSELKYINWLELNLAKYIDLDYENSK